MPRTTFHPEVHGFAFRGYFARMSLALPGGRRIEMCGRCGGMAAAALDYFHAGLAVPEPGAPGLVGYLQDRLRQSFAMPSALRFLLWTLAADVTVAQAVDGYEVPRLCRSIDAGYPAVVGLVGGTSADRIGAESRLAVAYGYELDRRSGGVRFQVYDGETPRQEVVLTVPAGAAAIAASNQARPWRGLFLQDYSFRRPPAPLDGEGDELLEAVA
jgi:hypothetical protein